MPRMFRTVKMFALGALFGAQELGKQATEIGTSRGGRGLLQKRGHKDDSSFFNRLLRDQIQDGAGCFRSLGEEGGMLNFDQALNFQLGDFKVLVEEPIGKFLRAREVFAITRIRSRGR